MGGASAMTNEAIHPGKLSCRQLVTNPWCLKKSLRHGQKEGIQAGEIAGWRSRGGEWTDIGREVWIRSSSNGGKAGWCKGNGATRIDEMEFEKMQKRKEKSYYYYYYYYYYYLLFIIIIILIIIIIVIVIFCFVGLSKSSSPFCHRIREPISA